MNQQMGNTECELAIYSPVTEVDSFPTLSSDTRQLSLLSGMPTPAKSSEKEPPKDGSLTCKCGKETLGCSIHPNTPEAWTASMRASLAKILAQPEVRQGLALKRAVASTVKSSASLAWYDQNTCSWKTSQQSLLMDSEQFSGTWPRSGMLANGLVYELPTVGRRTIEIDGGYLPTPVSIDAGSGRMNTSPHEGAKPRPTLALMARKNLWPTPRSCSAMAATITPESAWKENRFPNLETVVGRRMWATPTAHNAKETNAPSESTRNTPTLAAQAGGKLNPQWVEWLMGWPINHTALKAAETDKSRSKQRQRSKS
jgi:hypothetical protein